MLSDDDYKSQRLCILSVLASNPVFVESEAVMDLCDVFDMVRLFDPQQVTVEDVAKYGVLEHLVRVTTEDVTMFEGRLTSSVASKVSACAKSEAVMRNLEAAITVSDLQELPDLPSFVTVYQIAASGDVKKVEIDPEEAGQWPIVVCIDTDDFLGLLYSPVATCIDGYHAMSGADIRPILTDVMLHDFGLRLSVPKRLEEEDAGVATQTKPLKKAQRQASVQEKLEVIEMPRRQEQSASIDQVRRISIEPMQSVAIAAERPASKGVVLYKPRRSKAPRAAERPDYSSFPQTKPLWRESAKTAKDLARSSRESCGSTDSCQAW